MRNQLFQVWRTYYTRPMCIILTLLALTITAMLIVNSRSTNYTRTISPSVKSPAASLYTATHEFKTKLREVQPSEVRTLILAAGDANNFPDLSSLPNLKSIQITSPLLGDQDLQQLQSLAHLTGLELNTHELPVGFLAGLGDRIEELQIPSHLLVTHADELPSLRKLRLLRIDYSAPIADTTKVVATIPHLQSLTILPEEFYAPLSSGSQLSHPAPREIQLEREAVEPLIGHSSLKELFANWPTQMKQDRRLMQELRAYPLYYSQRQTNTLTFSVILTGVVGMMLLLQLGAQYLSPAATVLPKFDLPHQLVALAILSVGTLIAVVAMVATQTALLPALALALFVPTYLGWEQIIRASNLEWLKRVAVPFRMMVCFSFPLLQALQMFLPPRFAGTWGWFLEGDTPVTTTMILLVEFTILGGVMLNLSVLTRRLLEVSPELVHFSLSNWKNPTLANHPGGFVRWQWAKQDRNFTNLRYHPGSLWQQVSLVRRGNPYRPFAFMSVFILVIFVITFMQLVTARDQFATLSPSWFTSSIGRVAISTVLIQVSLMSFVIPLTFWYQRCKLLELEFCRPVHRRDFAKRLFASMALDQSIALFPLSLLIAYWIFNPPMELGREEVLKVLPLGAAVIGLAHATSTSLFAFKGVWHQAFAIASGGALVILGATLIGLKLSDLPDLRFNPTFSLIFILGTLTAMVLAIVANIWMFQKCCEREWG